MTSVTHSCCRSRLRLLEHPGLGGAPSGADVGRAASCQCSEPLPRPRLVSLPESGLLAASVRWLVAPFSFGSEGRRRPLLEPVALAPASPARRGPRALLSHCPSDVPRAESVGTGAVCAPDRLRARPSPELCPVGSPRPSPAACHRRTGGLRASPGPPLLQPRTQDGRPVPRRSCACLLQPRPRHRPGRLPSGGAEHGRFSLLSAM